MKKIITAMFMLLFVVFSVINVKASSWDEIVTTVEKGEDSRVLYNSMPTEIRKGDIITVKILVKNISGWKPLNGESEITWDDKAFEPVETNGKYYNVISDKIDGIVFNISGSNKASMQYTWKNFIASENTISFIELKFRVKSTVTDGVYKIKLIPKLTGDISVYGNGNYYNTFASDQPLQYLVGKPKITSNYTKSYLDSLDNSLYVIGSYMFNREVNDEYDGALRTEYIMLAAKSIDSDEKDDMIIYYKDLDGEWKNAITNNAVTVPNEFNITNINLKANYVKNGIYSDNGDATILRLIQVNEEQAIVTIENDKEKIHGVGTVSGDDVILTVGNNTYTITVSDTGVVIATSDTNLVNKNLQKRANTTIENYFNSEYAWLNYESDTPSHYLRSEHTGRYSYGNYELNLLRIGENNARVCLKEKNSNSCALDAIITSNFGTGHVGSVETTYAVILNDASYGFDWSSSGVTMSCLDGTCNESYAGTYIKEKQLSMQDVFDVWESNRIKYSVTFVENENTQHTIYITPGETLVGVNEYYEAYKHGFAFVEWQLDGEKFVSTTPITAPITLTAVFRQIPSAPELSISPQGVNHDYYNFEDNTFYYHFTIDTEDDFDGFTVYDSTTLPIQTVVRIIDGIVADISLDAGVQKTYYARTFIEVNGERYYSNSSNDITLNPQIYNVSFNTSGGTLINPVPVPYGETVEAPDPAPNKKYFVFSEWRYNDLPFNFATPITGDITLDAVWTPDIPVPVIADDGGSTYYDHSLRLANENVYCDKQGGGCNTSHDGYGISKYEVYIKNGVDYDYVDEFAPYETYDFTIEPNEIRIYVMKVIYGEGINAIPSGYSDEFTIDATLGIPEIAFNTSLPAPDGEYDVYKWIEVTNLVEDFGVDCTGDVCQSYTIDGFKLYDYDGEVYNYVSTFDVGDAVSVTLDYGEEKHFYVRAYANDSNSVPVLGGLSQVLVVTAPIPAPVISISQYEFNNPGIPNRNQPLAYEPEHQGTVFVQNIAFNSDYYQACNNPNDPYDCTYRVDGYEVFDVSGNDPVSLGTVAASTSETSVYIPVGSNKSFVAMAYVLDGNNEKIYSPASNEITYDLTNPTYTFTVTPSSNNANKVNIRGYINDYEVLFYGIKVNNTMYLDQGTNDDGEHLTIDASIMENVDEIVLGLAEPTVANPDDFALEVNATIDND